MTLRGTVVNGLVVLTGPQKFPEGSEVVVALADPDDLPPIDEVLEYPHPLAPYDREKEIALLRERIAAFKAGERGVPLGEAMDRIAAELNLPAVEHG